MGVSRALGRKLLCFPVQAGYLARFLVVFQDLVAQSAKFATESYLFAVETPVVKFGRIFSDFFWLAVLFWGHIGGVKGVVDASHSVFHSHFSLITVLSVSFVEIVQDFLLNCDLVFLFPFLSFCCSDF